MRKYLFFGLSLLLSNVIYNINYTYGFFGYKAEETSPNKNMKCQRIKYKNAIEDFAKYKDDTLIGTSANLLPVISTYDYFEKDYNTGMMILFNTTNKKITDLPIKNFPNEVSFNPHGMDLLDNKYLFIVNHAMKEEKERIEIVEIEEYKSKDTLNKGVFDIRLKYIDSIELPKDFLGRVNNVAAIKKDFFYFTTWQYLPAPTKENKDNVFENLKRKLYSHISIFFEIKKTYVYSYNKGVIRSIDSSKSLMNNGIAYNQDKNELYVAQTYERQILVYKLDKSMPDLNKIIKINYSPDNVYYDTKTKLINIAGTGPVYKFEKSTENVLKYDKSIPGYYGGLIQIDTENYNVIDKHILQEQFNPCSNAMNYDKFSIFSSPIMKGLYFCELQ